MILLGLLWCIFMGFVAYYWTGVMLNTEYRKPLQWLIAFASFGGWLNIIWWVVKYHI